jgi:hypothetical protein
MEDWDGVEVGPSTPPQSTGDVYACVMRGGVVSMDAFWGIRPRERGHQGSVRYSDAAGDIVCCYRNE